MQTTGVLTVADVLDEAPRSRFHLRTVVVSGAGFFTDAYDLFVIATVATLVTTQWKLSTTDKSWVTGAAILGAFIGAVVFGRVADLLGRKVVYAVVAAVMIGGALLSAFAQGVVWLILARLLIGLGIGGDYPVSAVMMSEYSNRRDRGRLVGLVFSMQAVGLIVGPLVALTLLASGVSHELTWRLLLGLGALPAGAVLWLRLRTPESPRYLAQVRGHDTKAAASLRAYSGGVASASEGDPGAGASAAGRLGLWKFLSDRRMIRLLIGTAGSWLLLDYALYGNTLSLPSILKKVSPTASITQQLLLTLAIFVVFAFPGYLTAVKFMDRIGHRRLQWIGFSVMAAAFLILGIVPAFTRYVGIFIPIFGISYFFIQFGPNMTTFVLPSEVFPLRARTTGHGIAAGIGKLGAFIGVFLVPSLQKSIGLRGMLVVAAASAVAGLALTFLVPETAGLSLDQASGEVPVAALPKSTTDEDRARELVTTA
jgi:MFS family permease